MRIVCYGDSITAVDHTYEYVARLGAENSNFVVIDEGHSAWKSEAITQRIEATVAGYSPDIVTIMMGVNDANVNGMNDWKGPLHSPHLPSEYYDRLTRAVNAISTAHPSARIIIMTPTPFTDGYSDHSDQLTHRNHFLGYLEQYNSQIQQWVVNHPDEAEMCDVYTPMMDDWLAYSEANPGDRLAINAYMLADSLHPNAHGHDIIYNTLLAQLETVQPPPLPIFDKRRLGLFMGWDQHKAVIQNPDTFMRVAFDGDSPNVMADAEIWFSTLWHFDAPDSWLPWSSTPQNGVGAVENILQRTDGTDKRIWLALCFNFNDDDQWTRYAELIDQLKHHDSLFTVGICTDEWVNYPATEAEAKEKFLQFRDVAWAAGKPAYAHLFFGWSGSQGPIPDGNAWFCQEYDLVMFHNNYPHYDTDGQSNLGVLRAMLNRGYASSCVGGTQGYFGATSGRQYRNGTPTESDYWIADDFINVINDFELVNDPNKAQVLFLAIHYIDNQWNERSVLHPTMESYGDWIIEGGESELPYGPAESPPVTITVTEATKTPVITNDNDTLSGEQPYTASISGYIRDPDTNVGLADKTLVLQINATGVMQTISASDGRYEFNHTFDSVGVFSAKTIFAGDQ
jgi:lysophospholipase L1-like esterase